VDVVSRETLEQQSPDKVSCPESAPKQNDADGGGDEDASDRAHDMTKRKRASALRYAGEQLRDKR
jgi:hypothetical protein